MGNLKVSFISLITSCLRSLYLSIFTYKCPVVWAVQPRGDEGLQVDDQRAVEQHHAHLKKDGYVGRQIAREYLDG